MRRNLTGGFTALLISLLLMSGCAKDQVKPDEGIASDKPAQAAQQSQQASDQAAAERKRIEQQIADQQAAAKREADRQAALKAEQLKEQQAKDDEAAGLMRPDQSTLASTAKASSSATDDAAKKALSKIHFDFDSYVLSQQARDTLYNNAEYLLKKYQGKVRLEGHCDERGSDEYNLALGENRAKAAMNYLVTLGVPAEQLAIVSYGKERPLVNEHTEEAWAQNRRVEFELVK